MGDECPNATWPNGKHCFTLANPNECAYCGAALSPPATPAPTLDETRNPIAAEIHRLCAAGDDQAVADRVMELLDEAFSEGRFAEMEPVILALDPNRLTPTATFALQCMFAAVLREPRLTPAAHAPTATPPLTERVRLTCRRCTETHATDPCPACGSGDVFVEAPTPAPSGTVAVRGRVVAVADGMASVQWKGGFASIMRLPGAKVGDEVTVTVAAGERAV